MAASARSAVRYLTSRARYGMKFGLGTIATLVKALGDPHLAYPTLLVAGTNGKGSVVADVDAALRASGLRVGRYTSPHLVRLNERIAVDGRDIEDDALAEAVARVRETAGRLVRRREIPAPPTFFEAMTAAAFEHFRRARVQVAVLEVGLGGRLDATNVAEPVASAIVTVARDHERFLGRDLPAIAREKAGVLRPGRATVLGPLPESARAAIEELATRLRARLVDAASARVERASGAVRVVTERGDYRSLRTLAGAHQVQNAVVAILLLEEAAASGLAFDPAALPSAFGSVRWPGRLQTIEGTPPLILDGAHNPAGARALADHLRPRRPFVLLFGVMVDKDARAMAEALFPLAEVVVLTRARAREAAAPQDVAAHAGDLAAAVHVEPSPSRALARARRIARARAASVVVAGSLYLVGEVLALTSAGGPTPRLRLRG